MSVFLKSLRTFEERIEALTSSRGYFAKNSTFSKQNWFWYHLFARPFLDQNFEVYFCDVKNGQLFLALINFILVCSIYLSIILKVFGSNESGHLYPWLGIFKLEMFIKYLLNEHFSNLVIKRDNFFAFKQVNFRMLSNLFR